MHTPDKIHQLQYDVLNYIVAYMESTGTVLNLVQFDADKKFTDDLNKVNGTNYSVAEVEKAIDKCLAREWFGHVAMTRSRYKNLGITQKGVDEATAKLKADELKLSRPLPKKASDYIEDHKGLFLFFGFLIALATFSLKLFG